MLGHGTTITFSSGFFANIQSMNWDGIARAPVDATDFATVGGKAYVPADLTDGGEVTVEVKHRLDAVPPIDGAAEAFTVNFPVTPPKTMTAQGFMTGYTISFVDEEFITATATIKITGGITWPVP